MILGNGISYPPPVSNNERQRQFRERNPGYYRRYRLRPEAAVAPVMESAPPALPAPAMHIEIPGMNAIDIPLASRAGAAAEGAD